jgi:DNA-binding LacI/PurR family transcriptional regulator
MAPHDQEQHVMREPARSRRPNKVTLTEVSGKAGVSLMTASRVLNGSADPVRIQDATRRKVLRAAELLGYRANSLAQAMRTGRTGNIGLVVVRRHDGRVLTDDQFYVQVIEGIEHELLANDNNVLLCLATPEEQRSGSLPRVATAGFVDGLVFLGVHERSYLQGLAGQYRPMVVIDEPGLAGVPSVFAANRNGGRLAARHLCHLGHRRLAAITTDVADRNFQQRLAGFRAEARRVGASVVAVARGDPWAEGGYVAMSALLDGSKPFTGVFCGNDSLAIYAMKACHDRGLDVPRDLSIMGFDDIAIGEHTSPSLTTVAVQKREMGIQAARLVRQLIDGPGPVGPQVTVPVALKQRQSTGPARAQAKR